MRILEYGVAAIVETIFFTGIACLIGAGITQMINRRSQRPNVMYRVRGHVTGRPRVTSATHIDQWRAAARPYYRRPRFVWLEELRAKHHMLNLGRLARKIERELERKQRRAERWQRNHRI